MNPTNYGLNQFLQPNNAPISQNGEGFVSSYDFGTDYDRGAITAYSIANLSVGNAQLATASIGTANIGTLTFNEISGGTATLGGTANGNGLLSVKDSSGTERVRADNTGLTVNDGSVTMKNSSGSTSFDYLGVVSNNNFSFSFGTVAAGLNQNISGTGDTSFTGGTLSFTLGRASLVLVNISVGMWLVGTTAGGVNGLGIAKIKLNGTEAARVVIGAAYTDLIYQSTFWLGNLSSGTNTFTATGLGPTAGTTTLNIYGYRMGYVILGT